MTSFGSYTEKFAPIRETIAKVPRVQLALTPTPLHEAPILAKRLGGPRIFLKRDDLTGVAFGGNKTRNLEFRLAKTMSENPDVVIVGLDLQSNSARQTVGSCNKLGLKTILVLEGERPDAVQGNLLVDYLLGAEVHFAPTREAQRSLLDELAGKVRAEGKVPHILNDNPMFDVASAIAYIECTMEILEQLEREGLRPSCLYMSSSGKGQAGLVLAQKLLGLECEMRCVTATAEYDDVPERTAEIANRTAEYLGMALQVNADDVVNLRDQVGEAYGIPTEAGNATVKLFAETEGVVLDPVYTGKAAAGMVAQIRAGQYSPADVVVFVHTGGTPAVFTHSDLWL